MINVILFGSNGMLGTYIKSFFKEKNNININCIDRTKFDVLNDLSKLELLIDTFENNCIVINSIGLIPQSIKNDSLINNEKNYYIINTLFPIILSILCEKKKFKLIHITTDCVFSGIKGEYIETDYHDAISSYGNSKSLSENMLFLNANTTIIRTSIIGEEKHNKYSLLEYVKKNNNNIINGYENHFWNGITCLELSKLIYKIIDEKLYWNGVRHIFSKEKVSKYELIKLIINIYDLNIKLNSVKDNIYCDRSLNTIYNDNFNIIPLIDQLKELKNYNIIKLYNE
jgi:dTDP-4-dehydrorhamnose reductase